jgi:hypothetical protein
MHFVRRHKLNSHAPVPIRGKQLPKQFQSELLLVDLNDDLDARFLILYSRRIAISSNAPTMEK